MYDSFKKGDDVFLVKGEAFEMSYTIINGSVIKKGRTYLNAETDETIIHFCDDELVGNDLFGHSYHLFHTEKEANNYVQEIKTSAIMKDKINRIVSRKCNFQELQDIYLYLEKKYPEEMR